MIIIKFLRELDAELERLQTARDTIATLIASSPTHPKQASRRRVARAVSLQQAVAEKVDVSAEAALPAPQGVQAVEGLPVAVEQPVLTLLKRRRGRPRGSVNRRPGAPRTRMAPTPEPTALAPVRAAGPVFVSAAELERHRQRTVVMAPPALKPVEHTSSEGTLDALIREVAERRTSAAA